MQAHSAPIGLTFYNGAQFPDAYQGLFVVFRGSWNRSVPTGYKLVHIPIATDGAPEPVQDFATGWLRADGSNFKLSKMLLCDRCEYIYQTLADLDRFPEAQAALGAMGAGDKVPPVPTAPTTTAHTQSQKEEAPVR